MQHDEKAQEIVTSCKLRSGNRDLEILHRENRGTGLRDDAEDQIVASIPLRSSYLQEDSRLVIESHHPPVSQSLHIRIRIALIGGKGQGRLRTSPGPFRLVAADNTNDRI